MTHIDVNEMDSWREVLGATWQQHPGDSAFITELWVSTPTLSKWSPQLERGNTQLSTHSYTDMLLLMWCVFCIHKSHKDYQWYRSEPYANQVPYESCQSTSSDWDLWYQQDVGVISFHPPQWPALLSRCPAAWRRYMFTAQLPFHQRGIFIRDKNHSGRWAVALRLLRPALAMISPRSSEEVPVVSTEKRSPLTPAAFKRHLSTFDDIQANPLPQCSKTHFKLLCHSSQ